MPRKRVHRLIPAAVTLVFEGHVLAVLVAALAAGFLPGRDWSRGNGRGPGVAEIPGALAAWVSPAIVTSRSALGRTRTSSGRPACCRGSLLR